MQMRGLQYNHDAYLRSQMSVLAYDIADRVRLNQADAVSYVSNYTVPTSAPGGCTPANVSATNDLACWHAQLFEALPPGSRANVTRVVTALAEEFTVSLEWDDREGESRAIAYTFVP